MTHRLLIVDDSKVMRDMVAACLRPLGEVSFEFAGSGLEAIERLALAGYDLVVLDLNMPAVRADAASAKICPFAGEREAGVAPAAAL